MMPPPPIPEIEHPDEATDVEIEIAVDNSPNFDASQSDSNDSESDSNEGYSLNGISERKL